MDLITLTLTKNHIWSSLSVLGLAGVTYLTNRYVNNTKQTSNQTNETRNTKTKKKLV